jgi:UDP-glucose 4-epimerase
VWPVPVEVGPTDHASVLAVASMVRTEAKRYTGAKVPVVHLPMRPGEPERGKVTADTSTLVRVDEDPAKFKPMGDGIAETVAWFVENEGVTWRRP